MLLYALFVALLISQAQLSVSTNHYSRFVRFLLLCLCVFSFCRSSFFCIFQCESGQTVCKLFWVLEIKWRPLSKFQLIRNLYRFLWHYYRTDRFLLSKLLQPHILPCRVHLCETHNNILWPHKNAHSIIIFLWRM